MLEFALTASSWWGIIFIISAIGARMGQLILTKEDKRSECIIVLVGTVILCLPSALVYGRILKWW